MGSGRLRFRLEAALAALCVAAFAATLVWPDWIELILGADPDHGDGSLERVVLLGLTGATALVMAGLAWRARPRRRPGSTVSTAATVATR